MTWYAHRNDNGVITSLHEEKQPGYAEEKLPNTHADVKAFFAAAYPEQPPPVATCSPAQAKIALRRAGLLGRVRQALAGDEELEIWFADAQVWRRDSPRIATIGASLGLTPKQIDDLFAQAALIDT